MIFHVQFRSQGRWATVREFTDILEAKRYFEQRKLETPQEILRFADRGGELAIYWPQDNRANPNLAHKNQQTEQ